MAAAPWPTRAARRWPRWTGLAVVALGTMAAVVVMRAPRVPAAPAPVLDAPPAALSRPAAASALVPPPVVVDAASPVPAPARVTRRETAPAAFPADTPIAAVAGESPKAAAAKAPVDAAGAGAAEARPTPAPATLTLQAISERNGQPIAIVNDRLVRVGDEVDGIRVLAIRGDEVDVEFHGHRTTLRF